MSNPFLLHSLYAVNSPARMNPGELRASLSLAAVFALRMFGMFVVLPVLALWAQGRPGWSLTLAASKRAVQPPFQLQRELAGNLCVIGKVR